MLPVCAAPLAEKKTPAALAPTARRPGRVVVLGAGNILLTDEGLGVRAIERLPLLYDLPAEVEIIDGGTCTMEMLEDLEDLEALIVVDAIRSGQPCGTPIRVAGDDIPVFFRSKLSPHQIGLGDVLATLELLGRAPRQTFLLGLEPHCLTLGIELSSAIEARMPELLHLIANELAALGLVVSPQIETA